MKDTLYHRRSNRLKNYDYSKPGLYFITICTDNRKNLFGKISERSMILNDTGKTANKCLLEIPVHFPMVILHEYIIMPNHIHGIIELKNTERSPELLRKNEFQKMIPHSIGSIVKGFKIGVTKWLRKEKPEHFPPSIPVWQRNYYEHIIRNADSFRHISDYIKYNPITWQEDKFFTE